MYGFISIENTVKIFGAAGWGAWGVGKGRNQDALLSHLSQVLLATLRLARRPIHSSDPLLQGLRVIRALLFFIIVPTRHPHPGGGRWRPRGDRVQADCSGPPGTRPPVLSRSLYVSSNCVVSRRLQESLLVEVDRVSEARLHLWYLVTDDLHQHFRELHLQRLRLAKGVEAEVQQVPHELHDKHKYTIFIVLLQCQLQLPGLEWINTTLMERIHMCEYCLRIHTCIWTWSLNASGGASLLCV